MLGKMVGRVAEAEQRDASFDRGRRTTGNTSVPPPPLLAPPPKLFLADESGVSGVSPPAPVEAAAIMSPTSTLQAAAAASPTSPPAAVFARHGASSSSSSGGRDDRQRNSSKSRSHHHHHRPAWEAARHTGVGLAGALNGDAAAATVLTGQSFRSAAFDGADGSAARSSLLMMSPREMEASEGYTRVIARGGPSTRTTHIFDGRVVAVDGEDGGGFLRWCHGCSKDLGQGKDIMYRGEMAFCSHECRYREMLLFGEES
ncbi:unnamed protein product [Urochloa humidicola]